MFFGTKQDYKDKINVVRNNLEYEERQTAHYKRLWEIVLSQRDKLVKEVESLKKTIQEGEKEVEKYYEGFSYNPDYVSNLKNNFINLTEKVNLANEKNKILKEKNNILEEHCLRYRTFFENMSTQLDLLKKVTNE